MLYTPGSVSNLRVDALPLTTSHSVHGPTWRFLRETATTMVQAITAYTLFSNRIFLRLEPLLELLLVDRALVSQAIRPLREYFAHISKNLNH